MIVQCEILDIFFFVKTKIFVDFQICISVPSRSIKMGYILSSRKSFVKEKAKKFNRLFQPNLPGGNIFTKAIQNKKAWRQDVISDIFVFLMQTLSKFKFYLFTLSKRFLKHVWPFCNIMHQRFNMKNQINTKWCCSFFFISDSTCICPRNWKCSWNVA